MIQPFTYRPSTQILSSLYTIVWDSRAKLYLLREVENGVGKK